MYAVYTLKDGKPDVFLQKVNNKDQLEEICNMYKTKGYQNVTWSNYLLYTTSVNYR